MKKIFIIALVMLLTACGSAPEEPQTDPVYKKDAKKSHLLSEHERALQKAKDVEKELKKADDKRRKVLDGEN